MASVLKWATLKSAWMWTNPTLCWTNRFCSWSSSRTSWRTPTMEWMWTGLTLVGIPQSLNSSSQESGLSIFCFLVSSWCWSGEWKWGWSVRVRFRGRIQLCGWWHLFPCINSVAPGHPNQTASQVTIRWLQQPASTKQQPSIPTLSRTDHKRTGAMPPSSHGLKSRSTGVEPRSRGVGRACGAFFVLPLDGIKDLQMCGCYVVWRYCWLPSNEVTLVWCSSRFRWHSVQGFVKYSCSRTRDVSFTLDVLFVRLSK